jgi:hypothetical protein
VIGRFTSAVSFYGTKDETFAQLLRSVQEILQGELGAKFRPYTIDQVHGTLIALDTVIVPDSGVLVNNHYRDVTHAQAPVDPGRVLRIIQSQLESPCRIRMGGYHANSDASFLSRGVHPFERMFSAQKQAFVLLGWPLATIRYGLSHRPLDDLRRTMNKAGVMHLYHDSMTDIDNDLYFVVGHQDDAPAEAVSVAVQKVKDYLADHPIEIDLGVNQVSIIVSESSTLAPAKFIGKIPADEAGILGLFGVGRLPSAVVGLSNVTVAQLDEALAVAPVEAVQNRLSYAAPADLPTAQACARRGLAYLAYAPLTAPSGPPLQAALRVARRRQASVQRVMLAWLREQAPNIVPLVGASRPASIRDSADLLTLTPDDLTDLGTARQRSN